MGEHALTAAGTRKRDALLDAAEHGLLEEGITVSMRSVAARAGASLGHLQHYFPSRTDLLRAVLNRSLQRSLDQLATITGASVDATTGGHPRLADPGDIVTVILEGQTPAAVRLFVDMWAAAAREDTIGQIVFDFYRDYICHIAGFITDTHTDLTPDIAHARAHTAVSLFIGAALTRTGIAGHRTPDTDAVITHTATALLSGRPTREPAPPTG